MQTDITRITTTKIKERLGNMPRGKENIKKKDLTPEGRF